MSSTPDASHPKEDHTMSNVVTLGFGMSLCLIGVKVSSSFIVPILGNLGSVSMALLYFSNSFANFFVPPILNLFKNERQTMFWMVFEYSLYVLEYAYIVPFINLLWNFVHGIFAAVLWTAEGIYLCSNSNDSDRGKKSGIFWAIYMIGAAAGNISVYFLLKKIGIQEYPSSSGWHGSASIMFLFLGFATLLGVIPMALLKPSPNESSRKFVAKTSPKVLMKKMIRLMISPNMRWLLLPMFFVGFQYVFIGSMLTRQVHATGNIGLMMSLFCIIETIASPLLGLILDKVGYVVMFIISTTLELSALLTFWFANKSQGGIFYLAFIFLSLSDSCYQTIIPPVIGRNYTDLESANATFRLCQYMGSCVCYLIAPLFVDTTTSWVSDKMLLRELIVCAVLCLLGLTSFFIYNKIFKKEMPVVEKETSEKKEVVQVANEDLEEINKEGDKSENKNEVAAKDVKDVKEEAQSNEDFRH